MYYEYYAHAMGSRCQTANTYLENHLETYENASVEDLIKHAIEAMKKAQDIPISEFNIDVSVVGKDTPFRKLKEDEIKKYIGNNNMQLD